MKVEIWSDVVCPWCGIGQRRLERALEGFGGEVEVVHRSFQLDPGYSGAPRPVSDMLRDKYGAGEAQQRAMSERIEALAAAEGLAPYRAGQGLVGNTRLVHELLAMAEARGLGDAAWRAAYRAYFGQGRAVFSLEDVVGLAAEVGLDAEEAREALEDGRYREAVEGDLREARALGVTGVPFVVVDRKYGVSGAQSVEVFRQVLERAWGERAPQAVIGGEGDGTCGPEGCEV